MNRGDGSNIDSTSRCAWQPWILLWNTLDHVSLALSLGGEIRGSGDGDRKLNLECAYVIWFMHICPFNEAGVDDF
jgi:hypothetical protein